ncbi:MAG TPA: O-antigen ligase family protein [Candidatus Saccharimonadales bacterium]|nr:O-antigen ligase family protein [Candidatus Saccharimonadales bacterium]
MKPAPTSLSLPPPGRWERAFIIVSLLLVTQALTPLIALGGTDADALGDSNTATMLSALAIYCVAFFLLMRRPIAMVDTARDDLLLLAMFLLPVASVVWSVDKSVSFRRVVALVMTGVYCIYIARRLSPRDFLRYLLLALFLGGIMSLAYTVIDPRDAIEHSAVNTGSWKGVYGHKAILGRIAALAVTVSVYVRPRHVWEGPMRWATIAMFIFLSVESQSRASWLMMLGGIGFMVLIAIVRNRRLSSGIKLTVAVLCGLAFVGLVATSWDYLLADVGRDATYSGRTTLWTGAIAVANAHHPILGAGYRAFWTATGAAGVRDYIQDWFRVPSHGHNGYLDVWLELGYAGVALFAVFLVAMIVRLTRRILREPAEPVWAAFAIFFFVFILNNFSISVAFKHTDIAWICAMLTGLYTRACVDTRLPVFSRTERRRLHLVIPAAVAGHHAPAGLARLAQAQ